MLLMRFTHRCMVTLCRLLFHYHNRTWNLPRCSARPCGYNCVYFHSGSLPTIALPVCPGNWPISAHLCRSNHSDLDKMEELLWPPRSWYGYSIYPPQTNAKDLVGRFWFMMFCCSWSTPLTGSDCYVIVLWTVLQLLWKYRKQNKCVSPTKTSVLSILWGGYPAVNIFVLEHVTGIDEKLSATGWEQFYRCIITL